MNVTRVKDLPEQARVLTVRAASRYDLLDTEGLAESLGISEAGLVSAMKRYGAPAPLAYLEPQPGSKRYVCLYRAEDIDRWIRSAQGPVTLASRVRVAPPRVATGRHPVTRPYAWRDGTRPAVVPDH